MVDEQELIKEGKRLYHKFYQREYRRKQKERIQQHKDNFYLKQGHRHTLQVPQSLNELEKQLDKLKYKSY